MEEAFDFQVKCHDRSHLIDKVVGAQAVANSKLNLGQVCGRSTAPPKVIVGR
jgi:hypothetical protein